MYYTGITIGPVFEGISKGHKTREIWYASYWFSQLAECLINKLKEINEVTFIVPYPDKEAFTNKENRAGVYPDRIIIETQNSVLEKIDGFVEDIINVLGPELDIVLKSAGGEEYLKRFLRINVAEIKESDAAANIIYQMNECLANSELTQSYMPLDENLFQEMLFNVTKTKAYKNLFGQRFPSIVEISTNGLSHPDGIFTDPDMDDDELWNKIIKIAKDEKKQKKTNPVYWNKLNISDKYIAIIEADGDNFGKIIKNIYESNPKAINEFSKAIGEFSVSATKIIYKWGGFPVYAGGDDLLWFHPIRSVNQETLEAGSFLSVIKEIDEKLVSIIKQYPQLTLIYEKLNKDVKTKVSLSYGVSIKYYKYPMHESLQDAKNILNGIKRNKTEIKNKIGISLAKHSGQTTNITIDKSMANYKNIYKFLSEEGLGFNAMIYTIDKYRVIIKAMLKSEKNLEPFFDNYFNEKTHFDKKFFIEKVSNIITGIYQELVIQNLTPEQSKADKKDHATIAILDNVSNDTLDSVKAILYFSKFLNQKENV